MPTVIRDGYTKYWSGRLVGIERMIEQKENEQFLVAGIGSALVDILVRENDSFLEKAGALKGGMVYVEPDHIEAMLSTASLPHRILPGGSACNTIIGVGMLGGNARFVGKSGSGRMAELYKKNLEDSHVEPILFQSPSPTGRVLSIITSDAQRSMLTYLGASAEILPYDITRDCFKGASIVHVEGYLLFDQDLIMAAFHAAKEAGAMISLDLASFNVVEASGDFLKDAVKNFVDILIANEDEASAYTGYSDESRAIAIMADDAEFAILKAGVRGSHIAHEGTIINIDPVIKREAVDTTGAGDLWASGFLYGLVNGYSLEKCGQLGSMCGYEVCQVVGAAIDEDGWKRIRNLID